MSNFYQAEPSFIANLSRGVADAKAYHENFLRTTVVTANGLFVPEPGEEAKRLLRRQDVPSAVVERIGGTAFVKRRPKETIDYDAYVRKRFQMEQPLLFRIPVGPVKNMLRNGDRQQPDLAEYLMYIQLARFAYAVASLYPYGMKIQIVPDDVRAQAANCCPDAYVRSYIDGVQALVRSLSFDLWITVESGQMRLCDMYRVNQYRQQAEEKLNLWRAGDPESFTLRWESALENARKNFVVALGRDPEQEIAASAWRYLVAHQSEVLSGMWSPVDAFPLVYANIPNVYQLYTTGSKRSQVPCEVRTKLPWQISLPESLLKAAA